MVDPSTGQLLAAGGNLLNTYLTNKNAGAQQQGGIQNAIDTTQGMYNQQSNLTNPYIQAGAGVGNAIQANTNPYIGAGQQAIGSLQGLQGGLNVNEFLDPSAHFSMQQGLGAINSQAAAKGGALSGAGLKDLTGYASNLASQNFQNATQNAMQNRGQQAGIGNTLYAGGMNAINLQEPIYQGGLQALGIQGQNANATQNNLTTLQQSMGNAQTGQTQMQGQNYGQAINALGGLFDQGMNAYTNYQAGQPGSPGVVDDTSTNMFANQDYSSAESTKQNIKDMGIGDIQQPMYAPVAESQFQPSTAIPLQGQYAGTPASAAGPAPADHSVAQRNTGYALKAGELLASYYSSEDTKSAVNNLSTNDITKSMDGMKAKTYEYTPEAQAKLGVPAGRRAGVMAEDVQKTPAAGMVNNTKPLSINIPKATSFVLAAVTQLNKRLGKLEGK